MYSKLKNTRYVPTYLGAVLIILFPVTDDEHGVIRLARIAFTALDRKHPAGIRQKRRIGTHQTDRHRPDETQHLLHVILVIRRQYPPSLHGGDGFIHLAIHARLLFSGVGVFPRGRDAESMEEIKRQEGIAARASLIVPRVAIDQFLSG